MNVNFTQIDYERPILILMAAGDAPIGVLGCAMNISPDINYNEISTLEFELPAYANGDAVPHYDRVVGMRTLELKGVGRFKLLDPEEIGDGVTKMKRCKAYSLEYEFAFKKITIPKGTYKFFNAPTTPGDNPTQEDTLIGMIMELMPNWTIGTVPSSLANKYRTYEVNNENLYNFMKGNMQEAYGCIFEFDTFHRIVNVRDVSVDATEMPIYISTQNLASEITIHENTDDVFTRIDVNGADGVNIRDVNPDGTNKIVMLDHYMTQDNFDDALIRKYFRWRDLVESKRGDYYALNVSYAMENMRLVVTEAKIADMRGELSILEAQRSVFIQAMAQGLRQAQSDVEEYNGLIASIEAKKLDIANMEDDITGIRSGLGDLLDSMRTINEVTRMSSFFEPGENKLLDRYIKDGEITESSFVMNSTGTLADRPETRDITGCTVTFQRGLCNIIDGRIYDVRGGEIEISTGGGTLVTAQLISAVVETDTNKRTVLSAYLNKGTFNGKPFGTACVSIVGDISFVGGGSGSDGSNVLHSLYYADGTMVFSYDVSEYEKRSVAWELYEYGLNAIKKLSQPSYTFSVSSANFISAEDFAEFRKNLKLGQKVYVALGEDKPRAPICTGVRLRYDDKKSLELKFGDTYVSSDSSFKLVDLLNKSISMGKNVEISKFVYSEYANSDAKTSIREYMDSALDVAKNAVMSSGEQAISFDDSGFRLRQRDVNGTDGYSDKQIWMINNSIVMTDDGWRTAKMAIGEFIDKDGTSRWGIVAPMIVGTMIAGEQLVIESAKRDGDTAVFRVDSDGCRLYNSDFSIQKGNTHIILNPELGIAIGEFPVYKETESAGAVTKSIDEDNAKFWVDSDGNVHFAGTLHGANGEFTGSVTATSLKIQREIQDEYGNTTVEDTDIDNYVNIVASDIVVSALDTTGGQEAENGIRINKNGVYITGVEVKMEISDGSEYLYITDAGVSGSRVTAPNVPERYCGPTFLYVNPGATTDEIQQGGYFRSLVDALASLQNVWLDKTVFIRMKNGMTEYGASDGFVRLSGLVGSGAVFISPETTDGYATISAKVFIRHSGCPVEIDRLLIGNHQQSECVVAEGHSVYLTLKDCRLTGYGSADLSSNCGVDARYGARVHINECVFFNLSRSMRAGKTAVITSDSNIGTGVVEADGGIVMATGSQPTQPESSTFTDWKSEINGGRVFYPGEQDPNPGTTDEDPPSVSITTTKTYSLTHSRTYARNWEWFDSTKERGDIVQGCVMTSNGLATCYGCMWFADVIKELKDKTILKATLRLHMVTRVGRGVNVAVELHGTDVEYNEQTGPSKQPLSIYGYGHIGKTTPGQTNVITIPNKVVSDLASGDIRALMLLSSDSTEHQAGCGYSKNYARFYGEANSDMTIRPELVVTYEEQT